MLTDVLIKLMKEFRDGMNGGVSIGDDISDLFENEHSVNQEWVMAPTLFVLYLAAVLETMSMDLHGGVYLQTRMDGKGLFKLSRLKSEKLSRRVGIRELLYPDYSALALNNLQEI